MARKLNYEEFEGDMAKSQLQKIEMYAKKLNEMINPEDELEGWVQSKLSRISTDIGDIKHYLDYEIKKLGNGGELVGNKIQGFLVTVNTNIDEDVISSPKSFKVYADDTDHAVEMAEYIYGPYYEDFQVVKIERFDDGGMVSQFRMKQAEELLGETMWSRFKEDEKEDVTKYLIKKGLIDIEDEEYDYDEDDDDDDELMGMTDIPEDRYGYKKGGYIGKGGLGLNSMDLEIIKKIDDPNYHEFVVSYDSVLKSWTWIGYGRMKSGFKTEEQALKSALDYERNIMMAKGGKINPPEDETNRKLKMLKDYIEANPDMNASDLEIFENKIRKIKGEAPIKRKFFEYINDYDDENLNQYIVVETGRETIEMGLTYDEAHELADRMNEGYDYEKYSVLTEMDR